jgi:hypothetical protein
MGDESDAKSASGDGTDEVRQTPDPHIACLSLNGCSSLANPNPNPKRKNLRFNSGLCLSQSEFSALRRSYPCSPLSHRCPIKAHFHRRSRVTVAEKQTLAEDTEEATRRKEIEAEERKKQSHDLVAESIRRELLESA